METAERGYNVYHWELTSGSFEIAPDVILAVSILKLSYSHFRCVALHEHRLGR